MGNLKEIIKDNKETIKSVLIAMSILLIIYLLSIKTFITINKDKGKWLIEFVSNDLLTTIITTIAGTLLGGYIAFRTAQYTLDTQLKKQSQIEFEKIKLENDIKNIHNFIDDLKTIQQFLDSDYRRNIEEIIVEKNKYLESLKIYEGPKIPLPSIKKEFRDLRHELIQNYEKLDRYKSKIQGLTEIVPANTREYIKTFINLIYGPVGVEYITKKIYQEISPIINNKLPKNLNGIISLNVFNEDLDASIAEISNLIEIELPKEINDLVNNLGEKI
ncbi:hypothetical protein BOVMAS02_14620 [Streptococcus uberis]|uniref:hypothetical protein n=1 Tax=Streptococcus uberis TaxID=1349 RepID=UPI0027DDCC2A|nr:hypothetical protein [Streptococcus uberis]MCK1192966.1 hypothetical protein [Streptococcus uberis]MCK1244596.1 hypothetical protein [Streptococcus uberis]MCK1246879.1 hypothetical protein [Streptococcus uberis]